MPKVSSLKIQLQNGTTNTLFASWGFSQSNLDHYEVKWHYDTGNGVWFAGDTANVTDKVSTYNIPSNAKNVKVTVKPVSKTYKKNNVDTYYWTGTSVSAKYNVSTSKPENITNAPKVEIDKYRLTATLTDIKDSKTDQVEFYVVKGTTKFKSGVVAVKTQQAVASCNVTAGEYYRVRCRAINVVGKTKVYGDWSPYSDAVTTIPQSVTNVKTKVLSESSIQVKWDKSPSATSYNIEYTTDKSFFNSNPNGITSATSDTTHAEITGLTPGEEYFFRVRAVNIVGNSGWSSIVSQIIGSTPAAPTAWSSTTTAVVGEDVKLQWVHNTEDGSKQTGAQIELTVNGATKVIDFTDDDKDDEDEVYKIYSYRLDLREYTEGAEILWRIRTKGITNKYSDWSVQSTIDLYAPPTLELHLGRHIDKWLWDTFNFETDSIDTAPAEEIIESFPYIIVATAGPNSQTPVAYHVIITAEETHETDNAIGGRTMVHAGDEVYSQIIHTSDNPLTIELNPSNITLENNQPYKVTVRVSMDSGLTAEESEIATTHWLDDICFPNASIAIDYDALCAYICPTCVDSDGNVVEDILLSVYRREYDGNFIELATDLENDGIVTITDPHPALDYARYRIVAKNKINSSIVYEDLPGIPVREPSIVIQWDEEWSDFDYAGIDKPEEPPWTGSMLKLPYNVDISEDHDPDVSLVKYIGREYPVAYYGTQKGEGGTWSCVIPANDKETIHAIRRLRDWNNDVYVREPSGLGYWAHIIVSMSTTHKELTIPVSFSVKRVEGGI